MPGKRSPQRLAARRMRARYHRHGVRCCSSPPALALSGVFVKVTSEDYVCNEDRLRFPIVVGSTKDPVFNDDPWMHAKCPPSSGGPCEISSAWKAYRPPVPAPAISTLDASATPFHPVGYATVSTSSVKHLQVMSELVHVQNNTIAMLSSLLESLGYPLHGGPYADIANASCREHGTSLPESSGQNQTQRNLAFTSSGEASNDDSLSVDMRRRLSIIEVDVTRLSKSLGQTVQKSLGLRTTNFLEQIGLPASPSKADLERVFYDLYRPHLFNLMPILESGVQEHVAKYSAELRQYFIGKVGELLKDYDGHNQKRLEVLQNELRQTFENSILKTLQPPASVVMDTGVGTTYDMSALATPLHVDICASVPTQSGRFTCSVFLEMARIARVIVPIIPVVEIKPLMICDGGIDSHNESVDSELPSEHECYYRRNQDYRT